MRGGGGGGGGGATGAAAGLSTGAATGAGALGDGVAPVEDCDGVARAGGFECAMGLGLGTEGSSGGGDDAIAGLT